MEFKNKVTGEIVKANCYAERFAYSHNSNFELVNPKKDNKPKEDSKPKTSDKPKIDKTNDENKGAEPKTGDEVIKDLLKDKN